MARGRSRAQYERLKRALERERNPHFTHLTSNMRKCFVQKMMISYLFNDTILYNMKRERFILFVRPFDMDCLWNIVVVIVVCLLLHVEWYLRRMLVLFLRLLLLLLLLCKIATYLRSHIHILDKCPEQLSTRNEHIYSLWWIISYQQEIQRWAREKHRIAHIYPKPFRHEWVITLKIFITIETWANALTWTR